MSGVVGPTMVSMEILLGVSTSQIALVLVFSSVGYTSGSILGGRSKLSVYIIITVWIGNLSETVFDLQTCKGKPLKFQYCHYLV